MWEIPCFLNFRWTLVRICLWFYCMRIAQLKSFSLDSLKIRWDFLLFFFSKRLLPWDFATLISFWSKSLHFCWQDDLILFAFKLVQFSIEIKKKVLFVICRCEIKAKLSYEFLLVYTNIVEVTTCNMCHDDFKSKSPMYSIRIITRT